MLNEYAIPLASLAISIGTTVFGVLSHRQKASVDYMDRLQRTIVDLETRVAKCETGREELRTTNIDLMARLLRMETLTDKRG